MKNKLFGIVLFLLLPLMAFSQPEETDLIRVFFLGGQSNMDGYGSVSDLPDSLNRTFDNAWIFHGNPVGDDQTEGGLGYWDLLKPGHGAGFSSNGVENRLSEGFGVELSFVRRLQELYPDDKIAIIKYSKGGSSLDSLGAGRWGSWEPDYQGISGLNQYDYFLKTINSALNTRDINGDGREDRLVPAGIIWMQGEGDSFSEEVAGRYYHHLKRLMDLLRAALRTDDLPVVIGKISDSWNTEDGKVWEYCDLVQHGQEKFVKGDGNAAIIRSTRYYNYSDPWHYDSEGYIDLGIKFADAVFQLNEKE